jgi:hypothetical protein
MSALDTLLTSVLQRAIAELIKARADVYTFAFCHDRDKHTLSVCADSAANSRRVIRKLNRQSMKRFAAAVRKRDLDEASVWQATVGRGLSLSEFAWTDLGQRSLGKLAHAPSLHAAMLQAAMKRAPEVVQLASDPEALLFTCSTVDEEVGLVWTADACKPSRESSQRAVGRARAR